MHDFILFNSSGFVRVSKEKVIIDIDADIVNYYRSLIPKSITLNTQKYKPHISVVRKELFCPDKVKKYDGQLIEFQYSHVIRNDNTYYWLDVFSLTLEQIRTDLGLVNQSLYIIPPKEYKHTFHITLGNKKHMEKQ
jgi:2'-5' RNA ligase